ncbi:hypothetical protein RHSIM_Rhsim05G0198800 [Rhododendron simsii]|uniref:Zinc finger BED domain-containing protein RICESLEEPER 2-like n=1 Tax=Rhododendron simsii TaxID=118357 RepID=A0A834LP85_RHOSS|nr:hypothetical protein RHSIM_Rhsim05G0198800 [Rhododendron simsii]
MSSAEKDEWMIVDQVMDSSNFDFTLGGELEDDVVDVEEVELGDMFVMVAQPSELPTSPTNETNQHFSLPNVEDSTGGMSLVVYCITIILPIAACLLLSSFVVPDMVAACAATVVLMGSSPNGRCFSTDCLLLRLLLLFSWPNENQIKLHSDQVKADCYGKFQVGESDETAYNASSNAMTIEYLKRKTMDWKRTVLEHEYIHMRFCAHILNLIVVEGLKDTSESILRIRDVVRYVRSSPQRMETFNKCVEKEKIKSKQTVCLDVCTRWNSTYLMLEVAIKFEKAFQRIGEEDISFIKIFGIKEGEEDLSLELEGLVAMDPRFKLRLVKFCYTKSKGKAESEKMEKKVKDVLNRLYDSYAKEGEVRQHVSSASQMPRVENENCDSRLNLAMVFDTYLEEEYSSVCFSEVDKYLGDLCERRDNPDFDILVWWKNNSNKYPILSKIEHDVLAKPVSTVASESAFSTGGRVLDPFRSSLSPSMVETLVCT